MKLISSVFLSINRFSSKNAIYSNAVKCPGDSIKISAREFKEKEIISDWIRVNYVK